MGNLDTVWKELKHNELNEEQLDEETSMAVYKDSEGKRVNAKTVKAAVADALGITVKEAERKIVRGLLPKSEVQRFVTDFLEGDVNEEDVDRIVKASEVNVGDRIRTEESGEVYTITSVDLKRIEKTENSEVYFRTKTDDGKIGMLTMDPKDKVYLCESVNEETKDEELVKVYVKVNGKWETLYESIPESKADAIWKAVFSAGENLISIENEEGRRVKEFNKKQMNKKED